MGKASDNEVLSAFAALVNMTAGEIERWHGTEQSRSVGQVCDDGVSIGVRAGQRTIEVLRLQRAPTADEIKHMRRVVSFIRRMSAQAPGKNRERSRWRYALMNWGHDPLRPSEAESPWR